MLRVREIVEGLKVFERNKMPFEVKVLGIATYIQTSSLGRTARILSLSFIQYLKPLFGKRECLKRNCLLVSEKKRRYLIALHLDEAVVKANKKEYYVYSAVYVEKNELILMRIYTNRNYPVTRSFLKEVLKFCENKPRFIVDKTPLAYRCTEKPESGVRRVPMYQR